MRVLVATPAYGGLVSVRFMLSFLQAAQDAQYRSITLGLYTIENESNISRARNRCAAAALRGGWDQLLFIDADITFTWENINQLLQSTRLVIAGLCPLKTYPIQLNFRPHDAEAESFPSGLTTYEEFLRWRTQDEMPVPQVGTAFMMIDCELILGKLKKYVPSYIYPDQISGTDEEHWHFFPDGPKLGDFLTEDYGFCHLLSEHLGVSPYVHTKCFVKHTGTHTFEVPQ